MRRGGPNYLKGLANMRALSEETGVPIEVMSLTTVVLNLANRMTLLRTLANFFISSYLWSTTVRLDRLSLNLDSGEHLERQTWGVRRPDCYSKSEQILMNAFNLGQRIWLTKWLCFRCTDRRQAWPGSASKRSIILVQEIDNVLRRDSLSPIIVVDFLISKSQRPCFSQWSFRN